MNWKKLGRALLFPHIAIIILLVPVSAVLLIGSMVFIGTNSVIAYISYVLAAYTLTVICFKIPRIVEFVESLPMTISGKICRALIRTLDSAKTNIIEPLKENVIEPIRDTLGLNKEEEKETK